MARNEPTRADRSFFGRRRGKTLRGGQAEALRQVLAQHLIDLERPAPADIAELFAHQPDRVILEIGFGGGEHLLHQCRTRPHAGFIGVEPFVNGMAKLAAALQREPLANIRLYDDDATRLLDWLPPASLDGIDLLYPDPWPKKRHWKRRFVNAANLDRLARVLKPGGLFRFTSDIDSYVTWTLLHCRAHPAFAWTARRADDWRKPFAGWPGTRYEAKALRQGRKPAYLAFKRLATTRSGASARRR